MSKRIDRDNAILMVCDMQDHFAEQSYGFKQVLAISEAMIHAAKIFKIPIVSTQHLKKVASSTMPSLKQLLKDNKHQVIVKQKFSMIVPEIQGYLNQYPDRKNIILVGLQAHICVFQTFLDLKEKGYDIWVLADGVSSLSSFERTIGLKRLYQQGARITSFQTIAFQLLKYSWDQNFVQICNTINKCQKINKLDHF